MKSYEKLEEMLKKGKVTRREFLAKASALGIGAAISPLIYHPRAIAAEPKKGGRFRVGFSTGSTSDFLDPATMSSAWIFYVSWQMRNNLVEVDNKGNAIPELAESWEPSADGTQWHFKLRKGVEFHNGKTLVADDVLYSLNYHRGKDTKSAGKPLLAPIKEIKADGKYSVIFELKGANADFPYVLSDWHFVISPEGTKRNEWEKGIGTGGYIMKDFEPGVRSLVKRNPNYFKEGRAHFDEVETLSIQDGTARTNALITGQIDYMNQCDVKTVHLLKKKAGIQVINVTSGAHYTMPMHTGLEPYDNIDVRLAFKYAIDREQMVKTILHGYGNVGNDHPLSPTSKYYANDLMQREYDPDKAKYHLKKAGMQGHTFNLQTCTLRDFNDCSVLFKEHAAKAGIDIKVDQVPSDGYWKNIWLKSPFCHSFWNPRPTADMMLTTVYDSKANWNESHFQNKRFDELLIAARAELDESKRKNMYEECQRILHDEGGTIVLMFKDFVEAANTKIKYDDLASNLSSDGWKSSERWWFA